MKLRLDSIRECFEGVIPATVATADLNGIPNVAFLSQVHYIDEQHVALSYQFFNKTRQNIRANARAALLVTNPITASRYALSLQYLHTETSGPLFEGMKAKLAGIASHTGMSEIFRLRGSDVYRVLDIQEVKCESLSLPMPERNLLSAMRACSKRVAACTDLEQLLSETLFSLHHYFGINHAMLLMYDHPRKRLYTVASHGYGESGIGSEIALGQGIIGVAAREMAPIRIGHMSSEYAYCRAIKENARISGWTGTFETEIPLPGLPESRSQLAVPISICRKLLGVLYVESPDDLRFSYDDEDALVMLADELGLTIHMLRKMAEEGDEAPALAAVASAASGPPLIVRHFAENDSIFLNDDYLIKGVAGAIFWTILHDYVDKDRVVFTNRELRLDPRIRLPDLCDNLEARLILLARRLVERDACVRIEKIGRGRFQLRLLCPVELQEVPQQARCRPVSHDVLQKPYS